MALFKGVKEGTIKHRIIEKAKNIAFTHPALNFLSRPRYQYNLEPSELAWLCQGITETFDDAKNDSKNGLGCVVEVGVARGMTTIFLLEHMRTLGDRRKYYCLDTFSGFTEEDIDFEVNRRRKKEKLYGGFSYNDLDVFKNNLKKEDYENVICIKYDAGKFDFSRLPTIDVILIDVDLYLPTIKCLENCWDHVNIGGRLLIDDVKDKGIYDGAYQAYTDFIKDKELAFITIGSKGGAIYKKSP